MLVPCAIEKQTHVLVCTNLASSHEMRVFNLIAESHLTGGSIVKGCKHTYTLSRTGCSCSTAHDQHIALIGCIREGAFGSLFSKPKLQQLDCTQNSFWARKHYIQIEAAAVLEGSCLDQEDALSFKPPLSFTK